MEVTIKIPKFILNRILEAGYTEEEAAEIFKKYLIEIMNDDYNQFNTDFDIWFDESIDVLS
jgi:hypothetical protein